MSRLVTNPFSSLSQRAKRCWARNLKSVTSSLEAMASSLRTEERLQQLVY